MINIALKSARGTRSVNLIEKDSTQHLDLISLCGHPRRPQYGSCMSVCPSVCLSVRPVQAPEKKQNRAKIGVNISLSRNNRCANIHFKRS